MSERVPASQVCLIFVGESGSGKSTAINTIIGRSVAPAAEGPNPVTQAVKIYKYKVDGVELVDTRGFGDRKTTTLKICEETVAALYDKASHKIHILVYCTSLKNRFITIDKQMVQAITEIFGPEIWSHAIILLTHSDLLEKPITAAEDAMHCIRTSLQSLGVQEKVVKEIPHCLAAKDVKLVLADKPRGEGQKETRKWPEEFFEKISAFGPDVANQLIKIRISIFQRFWNNHPIVARGLATGAVSVALNFVGGYALSIPFAAAAASGAKSVITSIITKFL